MKLWIKVTTLCVLGFSAGFAGIYAFISKRGDDSSAAQAAEGGKPTEVEWGLLRELDLATGKPSAALKKVDGAKVRVPGFIVPLEDNSESVSEFLLVPSPQACIHVPAPPSNQMIHVKMASGRRAQMSYGPVWVQGRMRFSEVNGPYGKSSYELTGEQVGS